MNLPFVRSLQCLTLASLFSLLAGCFGPEKPEDAAADFWTAVITNDADAVVAHSTLQDPEAFDGFGKNWNGYQPTWGKIVLDGDTASIETRLTAKDRENREVTTWLVQQDETWRVDYNRTGKSARGGLLGTLINKFSELGKELGDKFNQSAEEANQKMEQLLQELEDNEDAFSNQANQALEAYSAQLQQSLHTMDQSIQQTLEEQAGRLSETDTETLQEASKELEQRLRSIDPDSIQSALENSKALAEIRGRLERIDTQALEKQQQQWQELSDSLMKEVETLLEEMEK